MGAQSCWVREWAGGNHLWCLLRDFSFSPRCPRARGKCKGTLPAVNSLAVHIGSKREGFTGGQDGGNSSPDPTRCQETGDKKEEATETKERPSSPFSPLPFFLPWLLHRLVQVDSVCVPTHVRAPLSTSVTVGLRVILGCG